MNFESKHILAPELYGNFWLNSPPVLLREHAGEVILIDFWDYSNTDCVRTLPYIIEWQNRYSEYGLVVVGVHTPEFEFARSFDRVRNAVSHFNISYPVMLDNDAIIWNSYEVRNRPTRFLIDKDGFIRYIHYGEGGYIEFERAIQQLLIEAGYHGELPTLLPPLYEADQTGAVCYHSTNDLYLGYLRGALGNPEGYNPESTIEYKDPGIYLPERFYATGKWMNEKHCMRFNGRPGEDGAILIPYEGCDVNTVMGSQDGSPCHVTLQQDNKSLIKEISGEDILQLPDNRISLIIDIPRMYQIVRNKGFGKHLLKITTTNPNLEIYTFTFTTCLIPELVSAN